MTRFRLSPEAAQDLAEIYEYIAQDSVEAAARVRAEIYDALTGFGDDARQGAPARGSHSSAGAFLACSILSGGSPSAVEPFAERRGSPWKAEYSAHFESNDNLNSQTPFVNRIVKMPLWQVAEKRVAAALCCH